MRPRRDPATRRGRVASHDGDAALAAVARFRPQIALVDIGLPRMDGYELARRLLQLPHGARPEYIVAVTGYGLEADRQRAVQAGFHHHLVKPVDIDRVHRLITELASAVGPR